MLTLVMPNSSLRLLLRLHFFTFILLSFHFQLSGEHCSGGARVHHEQFLGFVLFYYLCISVLIEFGSPNTPTKPGHNLV